MSAAAQQVPATVSHRPRCRFCGVALEHSFVDLGMSPLCQTHIAQEQLNSMEPFYPLHAYVCSQCWLVQLEEFVAPADIFSEYAYFSSYADSWVAHAKRYALAMRDRFHIGAHSKVVEIASNDGYLLQHFVALGVPVLGVEPAANVAKVAIDRGIPTVVRFFGVASAKALAAEHGRADLLLGNNVLAHVPDINDFVGGMKVLLSSGGVITMEFPHLYELMRHNQFDTIYHEHFSYLSFLAVERIFAAHGITLFDVDRLSTHGGSIRIYGRHTEDVSKPITRAVEAMRQLERTEGFDRIETYAAFTEQVKETKRRILSMLIDLKRQGKRIAGYGAPGKGNTLLNYCSIRTDFLDFTVDRNPYKQGKYTPGTHIPILQPEAIFERKPDYVFVLPWNLRDEITEQMSGIRDWGGRFIIPIPFPQIVD